MAELINKSRKESFEHGVEAGLIRAKNELEKLITKKL